MEHRATLTIEHLTRRFGTRVAVNDVSLSFPSGQMVGIIGRSGAGKSTLLRTINRLIEPNAGWIGYGATDVTALRGRALRDWRTRCAMIFQQFQLVPRLDVLTNVLLGRLNHRSQIAGLFGLFSAEERAQALQTLERFGLLDVALSRAGQISGGQQQRVAICRALMQRPGIVLADEPIASLDPHNAQVVMDALRRVNREDGLTVLCNLHHLDTARTYCDRIVALDAGRVVFDGPAASLTDAAAAGVYGMEAEAADDPLLLRLHATAA